MQLQVITLGCVAICGLSGHKGWFYRDQSQEKGRWLLRYRRMQQLHQAADCHDGDDDGDNGADSDEGDGDGDDGGDDLQSADHQGADCDDGEGGL